MTTFRRDKIFRVKDTIRKTEKTEEKKNVAPFRVTPNGK
jgi:hypothetical protein